MSSPVARVHIDLPEGQQLAIAPSRAGAFDISADGQKIVYLADSGGTEHIVIREVRGFENRTLEGTQGAQQPFISPSGDWVGFFRNGSLLRVPIAGGAPIPITSIAGMTYGGSWAQDGKILFATDSALFLIRELGASPTRIPIDSVRFARWPHFAPDGKHALVNTD